MSKKRLSIKVNASDCLLKEFTTQEEMWNYLYTIQGFARRIDDDRLLNVMKKKFPHVNNKWRMAKIIDIFRYRDKRDNGILRASYYKGTPLPISYIASDTGSVWSSNQEFKVPEVKGVKFPPSIYKYIDLFRQRTNKKSFVLVFHY